MNSTDRSGRHVLYLSHGAGPLPVLGDDRHEEMVANLNQVAATLPKPSAILLVSAHWEEAVPTVTAGASPPLIYDYYGFPDASYELKYPAPGSPELAGAVRDVLNRGGIECSLDASRGFDHGMFIPLMLMYPAADIPCVQLSLRRSLDAEEHLRLGEALAGLDQENLLVVGSGFSFHNMRAFFASVEQSRVQNKAFERWLIETVADPALPQAKRRARLAAWESAPHARYCHPREEHLLPLHVCCGFAGTASAAHYELTILDKKASIYLW